MAQKVEQRIFRKFSQWYYIDAKKDMPIPDAPELVALLQAVGFNLKNMGQSSTSGSKKNVSSGLKVTIECGTSGVVAELLAPAETDCRCAVFSNREEANEQASFWTITTSQEKLREHIGSSLLPDVEGHRAKVIKEIFQLLQDELFELPHAAKADNKRRLSLPPVPKFVSEGSTSASSSSNSIQRSVDSHLDKSGSLHDWNEQDPESAEASKSNSLITRRASFGCGEDLKNVMPLPAKLPAKPKNLLAGSATSLADDVPAAAAPLKDSKTAALKKLLLSALDLLEPSKKQINGKPPLERKATFDIPSSTDDENTNKDPAKKKLKLAATPGPNGKRAPIAARLSTPATSRMPLSSPANGKKIPLSRATASSPMASMIPGACAARAKTAEILRRRTFVVNNEPRPVTRRASVLSPSIEMPESNVSVVAPTQQASKTRITKRVSLPARSTYAKENRPT